MNSQKLASTVWTLAKAGHASPTFVDAIAEAAKIRLKDFNFQHPANTTCAFASLSHASPALSAAIADVARVRLT
eukprot:5439541-Karenia_brevis.AAC.1